MQVNTLPHHDALIEVIGSDSLTLSEVVQRVRKPAREELAGYYAPLAVQVFLDQLVAWGMLTVSEGVYSAPA